MTITKADYAAQLVEQRFFTDFRELIAHYSDVVSGLTAFLQMNNPDELISLSNTPDPGLYRRLMAEALVTLIDRQALTPTAELNDLADRDLERLRKETGVGLEKLPLPPPRQPTAGESLEAEVIADYNGGLSATKMREKRNSNKAYNETYIRLAEGNQLESRITSNVRASA
jgi:hypothetical protein